MAEAQKIIKEAKSRGYADCAKYLKQHGDEHAQKKFRQETRGHTLGTIPHDEYGYWTGWLNRLVE